MPSAVLVGSGVFGVSGALALRRRGFDVTVFDPGPVPHPLAESTDISKIVRLDYGDDETYTEMMERALARWRGSSLAPFFHETGVLFLRGSPLAPGGFEHDSWALLTRRGHRLERLGAADVRRRYPAFTRPGAEGYFNPEGGWAESGNVVRHLAGEAKGAGVRFAEGAAIARLSESGSRVTGVVTASGDVVSADVVVVAAGSWTPYLVPGASHLFRAVGQPVFHLRPDAAAGWGAPGFPVFAADISSTGYYGFPRSDGGVVKVANHGVGRAMHPEAPARRVTAEEIEALRAFLREWVGGLADAPVAATRVCVYCDTYDQHFLIDRDPERPGLVVAAGGSGHAFKFTPLLGDWIADAALGKVVDKFRWRSPDGRVGEERARKRA